MYISSEIPYEIAARTAITQQNIALSVIKQSADADKAIANILDKSLSVTPSGRGGHVNLSA
jgi:hypothetical protein